MNIKPRILLIPNVAWWIIGEMGKQIVARFGDRYEFYFLPEGLLERRPDLLESLVPAVDAIHCLNESSIGLFGDFDPQALPPIATWIHHVTRWSPDHQMAAERSSALTVCTREWKEYLEERVSGRIPITVVPHGVDTDFFRRQTVSPRRFGIPARCFVLGFVGGKSSDFDNGRKGTDVLLDVVRGVAGQLPNLHVVIGGPGWEKEVAELKSLGVSVSSTGYLRKSDLPALYSAFDAYLLTSRVEGGPCTVFEAMACETPVVSTRVGIVPELIIDGVNGLSADVDDRDGLTAAVVQLGQSPEMRTTVGKNGKAAVATRTWAQTLSPLEDLYDEMIKRRRMNGYPQPGPPWMNNAQGLLRASCAADAIANVVPRVRKGSMSIARGFAQLSEMLDGQSVVDIAKGLGLLRGACFKTNS
jgi:glycosyltransferase involved in cell wall biosynthesis